MILQPLRKCLPCGPPRGVDSASDTGNAQTNENKIKRQQSAQRVGKPGGHSGRFSTYPRRWYSGQRHEVPKHGSQLKDLRIGIDGHLVRRVCGLVDRAPLSDLEQQLVRRNEERVLLKQPADNHDWMRAQGVHNHARAKFCQIISADHCIVVLGNHVVDPRLELDEVVDAWQVDKRPFHLSQEPCARVSCCRPGLEYLFESHQPGLLVEAASMERTVLPRPYLQLATARRLLHVDTCFGEPPEVFFPSIGVNEMEGFVPPVETILNERAKHAMLLVDAVKKRTNMMILVESTRGKLRGVRCGVHISPSRIKSVLGRWTGLARQTVYVLAPRAVDVTALSASTMVSTISVTTPTGHPHVVSVDSGPPVGLDIRILPGQSPKDFS